MILTDSEIQDLTRKVRPSAQKRALRQLGIDFKSRADGTLVVLRATVETALGNGTHQAHAEATLNFEAIK